MRVAVIGGGISGMVAARALAGASVAALADISGGISADISGGIEGIEVDLFEASSRLGGKLHSVKFGGTYVDVGPDSFLARRPEAVKLCGELGISDDLEAPGVKGAFIVVDNRLRKIPSDLALGVPVRLGSLIRSVVEHRILTVRGMSRAAVGYFFPTPPDMSLYGVGHQGALYSTSSHKPSTDPDLSYDVDLGRLIEHHMGREVVAKLADPLIGGIHAGSIYGMSAAALFPPILQASKQQGSLAVNLSRAMSEGQSTSGGQNAKDVKGGQNAKVAEAGQGNPPPTFYAVRGGMAYLVGALENDLLQKGIVIHEDTDVVALEKSSKGWTLLLDDGEKADGYAGVVLALPAHRASGLVESFSTDAARLFRSIPYSSVAVITLRIKEVSAEGLPGGTGYVVPADGRRLVSACTFLSKKWPHIATQDSVLLRVSTGRYGDSRHLYMDDQHLIDAVHHELERDLQLSLELEDALVVRWEKAFPQYRVGHLSLVAQIAEEIGRAGPVSVAGAAYGGVGIPACIKSGYEAASSLIKQLVLA